MAHLVEQVPKESLNVFERAGIWFDQQAQESPVLITISVLALDLILYVGLCFAVIASGYNPVVMGIAAVVAMAMVGYSAWILANICILNSQDATMRMAGRSVLVCESCKDKLIFHK